MFLLLPLRSFADLTCPSILSTNGYIQVFRGEARPVSRTTLSPNQSRHFSYFLYSHLPLFRQFVHNNDSDYNANDAYTDQMLSELIVEAYLSDSIEIDDNLIGLKRGSAFRLMLKILEIHNQREDKSNRFE